MGMSKKRQVEAFLARFILKESLQTELRKIKGLEDANIVLETRSDGKVGGYIVSDCFNGMSQISRQDLIWDHLEKNIDLSGNIVALLTFTSEEIEDDL